MIDIDIDLLIETTESWIEELKGTGEVAKGIVLLCALKLFKEQKERERGDVSPRTEPEEGEIGK